MNRIAELPRAARAFGLGPLLGLALGAVAAAQSPAPPVLLPLALAAPPALADPGGWPPRPDAEAPPGSNVTAPLARDAFRVRYRLHHEQGEDLRRGSSGSSVAEVLAAGFAEAPVESVRDTHEFLVEYGLGEDLMVSLVLPFAGLELVQADLDGETAIDRTSGLGDIQIGGRVELSEQQDERWALGLGLSIPTGSNSENRSVAPGNNPRLPYPLQLGSGTLDLRPELIWTRWTRRWSYGARAGAVLRTGSGDEDYTLGDRAELTAWVARRIDRDHSLSIRVLASRQGGIDGADPELDPLQSPAASPGSRGLFRLDAFLGVQYVGVAGHRFAAELGGPLLQHADGFQVDTDVVGVLSWSYSF